VAGQLLLFSALFFALALITDTAYALLAGKVGDLLRGSSTFRRRQRYVSAAMYIGLGLAAAVSGVVAY
jgi:threonine/homoserine/homoserine lactone efflux protein